MQTPDTNTAIVTLPKAVVTVTSTDVTVMTTKRLHVVTWTDLVDLLEDLAEDGEAESTVTPIETPKDTAARNRRALMVWLSTRTGVQVAPHTATRNGHSDPTPFVSSLRTHGHLLSDDYDTPYTA